MENNHGSLRRVQAADDPRGGIRSVVGQRWQPKHQISSSVIDRWRRQAGKENWIIAQVPVELPNVLHFLQAHA
ncbi:MAG TPA: hypothetical protein VNM15_03850 [Candidatus Binatia bacterium]|nr:hypothetical protein [Candidatus Binatia bacterium]